MVAVDITRVNICLRIAGKLQIFLRYLTISCDSDIHSFICCQGTLSLDINEIDIDAVDATSIYPVSIAIEES